MADEKKNYRVRPGVVVKVGKPGNIQKYKAGAEVNLSDAEVGKQGWKLEPVGWVRNVKDPETKPVKKLETK
jgi:hypothetical protein